MQARTHARTHAHTHTNTHTETVVRGKGIHQGNLYSLLCDLDHPAPNIQNGSLIIWHRITWSDTKTSLSRQSRCSVSHRQMDKSLLAYKGVRFGTQRLLKNKQKGVQRQTETARTRTYPPDRWCQAIDRWDHFNHTAAGSRAP